MNWKYDLPLTVELLARCFYYELSWICVPLSMQYDANGLYNSDGPVWNLQSVFSFSIFFAFLEDIH